MQLEKIVEELSGIRESMEDLQMISESLDDLCDTLNELHQSIMVLCILKIAEVRPDLKDKMEPMFKELVASFDMNKEDEE